MSGSSAVALLAAEVAAAARRPGAARTMLLDLDGTLAPIAERPEAARVPVAVLGALDRLVASGWTVAIVSGRPAAEVRALVRLTGVRVYGGHGIEGLRPGSRVRMRRELRRRLRALAARAEAFAWRTPGARVEIKPAGVALHDREVLPYDLPAWRRRVRALLASSDLEGLEVVRGSRVVEIRPRGIHKGLVAHALAPRTRRAARDASLVALGDDCTDEDLFRALRGVGLAVRVGRKGAPTAAVRRLPSPAAVARFLEAVASEPARGRTRGPR